MITPDTNFGFAEIIDNAPEKLEELMRTLENNTIIDITRRISKALNKGESIPETAQYQLNRISEIRGFNEFYQNEIAKITELSLAEIDNLIIEAARKSHAYDLSRFLEPDIRSRIPERGSEQLQQFTGAIRNHTKEEFQNITRTMGFNGTEARRYFIKTLDNAAMQVLSGLFDYNTVIRRTVQELTKSGLQSIQYGQRNLNVVTAIRNNVLTSVRQIAGQAAITNIEALGLRLIETSAHFGARNKGLGFENHESWQGKRFSISSYDDLRNAAHGENNRQNPQNPLQNSSDNGIIKTGGDDVTDLKIGYSENYSTIIDIKNINFSDAKEIAELTDDFADRYAYADVEYALEISPTGRAYTLKGINGFVSLEMLGREILKGSISIHNHPVPSEKIMGDSFSKQDLGFATEYKLGKQYLISGKRRNAFEYIGKLGYDEIIQEYKKAFDIVRNIAWDTGIEIYAEKQQVMEKLNEILEGFTFYENF